MKTDSSRLDLDGQYLEAILPEPFTILGQSLHPFSLGHVVLFHRFGLAYITGGPVPAEDLITAVIICSGTFEEAIQFFKSDHAKTLRTWMKKMKGVNLEEKNQLFYQYLEAGLKGPKVNAAGDGRELSAPWVLSLRVFLMRELHLTESQAMNYPIAKALWDRATVGEIQGTLSFETIDYKSLRQFANEIWKKG